MGYLRTKLEALLGGEPKGKPFDGAKAVPIEIWGSIDPRSNHGLGRTARTGKALSMLSYVQSALKKFTFAA